MDIASRIVRIPVILCLSTFDLARFSQTHSREIQLSTFRWGLIDSGCQQPRSRGHVQLRLNLNHILRLHRVEASPQPNFSQHNFSAKTRPQSRQDTKAGHLAMSRHIDLRRVFAIFPSLPPLSGHFHFQPRLDSNHARAPCDVASQSRGSSTPLFLRHSSFRPRLRLDPNHARTPRPGTFRCRIEPSCFFAIFPSPTHFFSVKTRKLRHRARRPCASRYWTLLPSRSFFHVFYSRHLPLSQDQIKTASQTNKTVHLAILNALIESRYFSLAILSFSDMGEEFRKSEKPKKVGKVKTISEYLPCNEDFC